MKDRVNEFCGRNRWSRKTFVSSQNAAILQYRVPLRGKGFVVSAKYPKSRRREYKADEMSVRELFPELNWSRSSSSRTQRTCRCESHESSDLPRMRFTRQAILAMNRKQTWCNVRKRTLKNRCCTFLANLTHSQFNANANSRSMFWSRNVVRILIEFYSNIASTMLECRRCISCITVFAQGLFRVLLRNNGAKTPGARSYIEAISFK